MCPGHAAIADMAAAVEAARLIAYWAVFSAAREEPDPLLFLASAVPLSLDPLFSRVVAQLMMSSLAL